MQSDVCICQEIDYLFSHRYVLVVGLFLQVFDQHGSPFTYHFVLLRLVIFANVIVSTEKAIEVTTSD